LVDLKAVLKELDEINREYVEVNEPILGYALIKIQDMNAQE
jgi:hypothetical protein